jgi:hypothetical protein
MTLSFECHAEVWGVDVLLNYGTSQKCRGGATFVCDSIRFAGGLMMWLRLLGDERCVFLIPVARAVKVSLAR